MVEWEHIGFGNYKARHPSGNGWLSTGQGVERYRCYWIKDRGEDELLSADEAHRIYANSVNPPPIRGYRFDEVFTPRSEMFEAKLQMRLESSEPKCANCRFWYQMTTNSRSGPLPGNFGICNLTGRDDPVDDGAPFTWSTSDLTVCSKWQAKD